VLPDVPTAQEKGVDVIAKANRIWLAPKGTPPERLEYLTGALREAMASPEVQQRFEDLGLVPRFVEPEEIEAELDSWRDNTLPLVAKARELQG